MTPYGRPDLSEKYSYIIVGAGLAGLSLLVELLSRRNFVEGKILLLDQSFSNYSERTWCFWDNEVNPYDNLLEKKWNIIKLHLPNSVLNIGLGELTYNMMNSSRFRDYAFQIIDESERVDKLETSVWDVSSFGDGAKVTTDAGNFLGNLVFDSRMDLGVLENYKGNKLWQQFRGWYIETRDPVFEQEKATLMDFRTEQEASVAFYYILPVHSRKALVEFTLFTSELKPREFYEQGLEKYLTQRIGDSEYAITSTEEGIIPMTDYPFGQEGEQKIIPIGTAGGWTKPSTGYTFTFVRKEVQRIVDDLSNGINPSGRTKYFKTRFWLYDRILLRILTKYPQRGAGILFSLFEKNPPGKIFKFLNNETTLWEELKIFTKLPVLLFLKTAIIEIFRSRIK